MPASRGAPSGSLESWFAVWHPSYRRRLLEIGALAFAIGLLVYLENVALREFSKSFIADRKLLEGDRVLAWLSPAAQDMAIRLPLVVLMLFAVLRIGRVGVDVLSRKLSATLTHRARSDLEKQILDHLLRKDDAFFTSRPPAEILNRLSSDIDRVNDRRTSLNQQRQSIFLIVGNIYFFWNENWRLALAGIATCAAGAWAMHRLTKPVKSMDRSYMSSDDRVKSTFEDFLRASPEVQVADLRGAVRTRFERVQDARRSLFMRFTALNSRLHIAQAGSYLFAFVSLCIIPLYLVHDPVANVGLTLVPVVVKALPELFSNSSQLVFQRLSLQLAETSVTRLLEYDSGIADTKSTATSTAVAKSAPLRIEDVTYRYRTAEGSLQGGIVGATTEIPTDYWTAIVGPAGSGKSTFLQLIVARTRAQSGKVLFGDVPYDDMTAGERAGVLTLMPQTLAILDATIADNLTFSSGTTSSELTEGDLEIVEKTGLGAICQLKALTMMPSDASGDASGGGIAKRIGEIRQKVRKRLTDEGFTVAPFDEGGRDPDDTVIERLANARADRARTLEQLLDPRARRALDKLAASPLGSALVARVAPMLEETRALLSLPSFAEYSKLAAVPIDERIWQRRVAAIGMPPSKRRGRSEQRDLLLVALTAKVSEYGEPPEANPSSSVDAVKSVLADVSVPLDATKTHPFLTWRDNVVFGRVDAPNSRAEGRVDQLVLDTLVSAGHDRDLIRIGLTFSVGRGGTRLSGGQRQIIALTRALLRRTPVLVLDEPTSALDPNSRTRVAKLLKEWAKGRVVVTVSHDPEFVREADQIRMFEAGRLVAQGRFEDLHRDSAAFRNVLKL